MEYTDVRNAWRCEYCDKLIYNLDEWGHPAAGAPPPRFLSRAYTKVCTLCFDIAHLLDENLYFQKIQAAWEESCTKKKSNY